MGIDIRLPNINGASESEQLAQIRSYLYQFAEQMKWAIDTIDSGNSTSIFNGNTGNAVSSSGGGTANTQSEMSNFDSIKALIIKSADIVDAYYEEINRRLSGEYVAQSTFGEYSQQTSQAITETSSQITRNFENIEKINSDIKVINERLTDAYIKQGHIDNKDVYGEGIELNLRNDGGESNIPMPADGVYEISSFSDMGIDGYVAYWFSPSIGVLCVGEAREDVTVGTKVTLTFEPSTSKIPAWDIKSSVFTPITGTIPVYGLEIGQTSEIDGVEVFDKFARFTSDRLSFYDKNDTEVAYISDYKLYITYAEIGTLKLGAYIIDTTNGLAIKWVGRS